MKTCSVSGCNRKRSARGWCNAHYLRWYKTGDLQTALPIRDVYRTAAESFKARTARTSNGCLEWIGAKNPDGYGLISVDGRLRSVHRYAWEQERGAIPPKMQIDHRCFNVACVDINHLRLATHAENNRNLSGPIATNKSSGVRNVYRDRGKWDVCIEKDGVRHRFGRFESIDEAAAVAAQARAELFGEFAGPGAVLTEQLAANHAEGAAA